MDNTLHSGTGHVAAVFAQFLNSQISAAYNRSVGCCVADDLVAEFLALEDKYHRKGITTSGKWKWHVLSGNYQLYKTGWGHVESGSYVSNSRRPGRGGGAGWWPVC